MSYHETLPAPTKPLPAGFDYDNCLTTCFPIERCYVHALADPACSEIHEPLRKSLEEWTTGDQRHYRGALVIGEYYNVSSFMSLPVLYPRIMAADIPWYHKTGARHFHYMHTPTRLGGTWRLNQYLLGRFTWNVQTDVNGVLDDYFARCYPTTSGKTREFDRELEFATANFKAFKHYVGVDGKIYTLRSRLVSDEQPMFPLDHLRYERHVPSQNDGPDVVEIVEAMGQARRLIDDALRACQDAHERERLQEDERRFAYGDATVRFYDHLIRSALSHRRGDAEESRREFAAVEREAVFLRTIVDLVQVSSSHANAANGLEATQAVAAYEFFRSLEEREATGAEVRYALGAECRTEQVWVKRDVWHDPNASMCMIGGEKHCLIEKHWAWADFEATLDPPRLGAQPERHLIDPHDRESRSTANKLIGEKHHETRIDIPRHPAPERRG